MANKEKAEEKAREENARLRARIAELEQEKADREALATASDAPLGEKTVIEERDRLRALKDKAIANGGITYKDIHDHKNIPLYHTNGLRIGKMVGPVHPGNAEDVFVAFKKVGIILSIDKPSAEAIAKYKASSTFKKLDEAFQKRRALKEKSRKDSEIERLTRLIAQSQGIDPSKLNSIKSREEVGV